jgi:hypothetical protein
MTLVSMGLTAPATPLLASGTAAEVEDLTVSDKGVATDAENNAGVHTEDITRKLKDSERKKKERAAAAAAKLIQGESSTSASKLMPERCSPRKSSPEKSLRAGAGAVVNWSVSDDVRMVLVACCPQIQKLFELLGHSSNRAELQGSNSATDARPTTAFFEKVAELFSDPAFKGAVPVEWARDEHLPLTRVYALRQGRSTAWMKEKWRSLGARYEVAWRRYSGVSGTDGYSCFCGCGKGGFWTTSGFVASHANKLSSDAAIDDNGDRTCVASSPHLGVYVWSVAMENNACMRVKGSVTIPAGVRSEGLVGMARAQLASRKAPRGGKGGGAGGMHAQGIHSSDDDDDGEPALKKQKKAKAVSYDHTAATFLDDGKPCKSTRATRESSMIAALAKLAPQQQTPLDVLFKRRAQLLEEDQTLMTNLTLAQNLLNSTDAGDAAGVLWAKGKIAKLRETSNKADIARDANETDILEAQEKEQERQRVQGCRKKLLSSLEHTGSKDSNSDGDDMNEVEE